MHTSRRCRGGERRWRRARLLRRCAPRNDKGARGVPTRFTSAIGRDCKCEFLEGAGGGERRRRPARLLRRSAPRNDKGARGVPTRFTSAIGRDSRCEFLEGAGAGSVGGDGRGCFGAARLAMTKGPAAFLHASRARSGETVNAYFSKVPGRGASEETGEVASALRASQ